MQRSAGTSSSYPAVGSSSSDAAAVLQQAEEMQLDVTEGDHSYQEGQTQVGQDHEGETSACSL